MTTLHFYLTIVNSKQILLSLILHRKILLLSALPEEVQGMPYEVTLTGVGLHTGKNVTLKFTPAEANSGYKFIRYDLEDSPVIEADVQWVTDTQRGTNLEKNLGLV